MRDRWDASKLDQGVPKSRLLCADLEVALPFYGLKAGSGISEFSPACTQPTTRTVSVGGLGGPRGWLHFVPPAASTAVSSETALDSAISQTSLLGSVLAEDMRDHAYRAQAVSHARSSAALQILAAPSAVAEISVEVPL